MLKFNFNTFMIDKCLTVGDLAALLEVHISQASKIIKRGRIKPKLLHRMLKHYSDVHQYVTEVSDVSFG